MSHRYARSATPASPELRGKFAATTQRMMALDPDVWFGFYLQSQGERILSDLQMITDAVPAPGRVLDIGCMPPFAVATLKAMGYDATGVDINPSLSPRSRQELQLQVVGCDIERDRLPFDDGTFDIVSICEVFEHLRINPVFTMREVFRVIRPGGILHLSTPNMFSLGGIRALLVKRRSSFWSDNELFDELNGVNTGYAGHVREYTYQEVHDFVMRLGFSRAQCTFRLGGEKRWTKPIYRLAPVLRPNVAVQAWK
jgi:SAM-dependent methyltransferase